MKRIVLASDHAGFELKNAMKVFLEKKGYKIKDLGAENGEKSISYAKQGMKLGKWIAHHDDELGLAFCGTGIGISIAANRVKGARSARITSIADAKMAKAHNSANILAMGGRITSIKKAVDMFNAFVRTIYEGGRHEKRIEQLDK